MKKAFGVVLLALMTLSLFATSAPGGPSGLDVYNNALPDDDGSGGGQWSMCVKFYNADGTLRGDNGRCD